MHQLTKTLEPTGDVCVKFTEEELSKLNLSSGEKLSVAVNATGELVLSKFSTIELDMSDWTRETLEFLLAESCTRDVGVNQIIAEVLEKALETSDELPELTANDNGNY
jgi:hypothetical protein